MTPAEVLERGADLMELNGWFGHCGDVTPGILDGHTARPMCAMYAIMEAANPKMQNPLCVPFAPVGHDADAKRAAEVFQRTLGLLRKGKHPDWVVIVNWNNEKGRTRDEVVSAFRAVAATWRAQHEQTQPQTELA